MLIYGKTTHVGDQRGFVNNTGLYLILYFNSDFNTLVFIIHLHYLIKQWVLSDTCIIFSERGICIDIANSCCKVHCRKCSLLTVALLLHHWTSKNYGMTITNTLPMDNHLCNIASKVSCSVGFICRNLRECIPTVKGAFNSHGHTRVHVNHLGPIHKTSIHALQLKQRKYAPYVFKH